jgi:hypothetical protein
MYTTIGTYVLLFLDDFLLCWFGCSNPIRTTDSHLKRIVRTNCCKHTVVPSDDGPSYARNMYRLTKDTKNTLCVKLVFLYTIISRCTVNKTKNLEVSVLLQSSACSTLCREDSGDGHAA